MKIADLMPQIAPSAFEEFFDSWLSTWGATSQLQDTARTSYTYFKGYVTNDAEEEGKP